VNANRRTALVGMSAAAVTSLLPRTARAEPAQLRVGIIPIVGVAPYYAAVQQGYFGAENVAVTTQVVRAGAAAIPALVGNSFDIIYSNGTSIVEAIAKGIDLRIIIQSAPIGKTPPDPGALIRRKGEQLRSGKDLEGKVVAINAVRDTQWMFLKAWVKQTGGDPEKVQIIEVALPAMLEALKAKRVDAALVLDPFMTFAFGDPAVELLDWPLSKVYPGGSVAFFAITPQMAEQRPSDVRAFVRAYKRGVTWLDANEGTDAYFALLAGFTGLDQTVVRKMKLAPAHADIIPSVLPRLTALMTQTGLLTTPVDLRSKVFL
jgi:NitT/TauT family transport system substrate-binding protein